MENDRLAHLTNPAKEKPLLAQPDKRFTDEELAQLKADVARRLIDAFETENAVVISEGLKTTTSVAWMYLTGKRLPAPEMLVQFQASTGISIDWLMTGKGAKYLSDKTKSRFSEEDEQQIRQLAQANGITFEQQVSDLASAGLKFLSHLKAKD